MCVNTRIWHLDIYPNPNNIAIIINTQSQIADQLNSTNKKFKFSQISHNPSTTHQNRHKIRRGEKKNRLTGSRRRWRMVIWSQWRGTGRRRVNRLTNLRVHRRNMRRLRGGRRRHLLVHGYVRIVGWNACSVSAWIVVVLHFFWVSSFFRNPIKNPQFQFRISNPNC